LILKIINWQLADIILSIGWFLISVWKHAILQNNCPGNNECYRRRKLRKCSLHRISSCYSYSYNSLY